MYKGERFMKKGLPILNNVLETINIFYMVVTVHYPSLWLWEYSKVFFSYHQIYIQISSCVKEQNAMKSLQHNIFCFLVLLLLILSISDRLLYRPFLPEAKGFFIFALLIFISLQLPTQIQGSCSLLWNTRV